MEELLRNSCIEIIELSILFLGNVSGKDNDMRNIKQSILLGMMTFAFWGVLYPQFSLVEECYEVAKKEKVPQKDFFSILEADKGEIVISSKLLEMWKAKRWK